MVCVIKQKIITYFDFQLQEPPEPLQVERSTGLFDSRSTAFQKTLLISGTLLIFCILCGIIWDIIRHIRERTKIKPHSRFFYHFHGNLKFPGSNPSPYHYLDLFVVVPSSTPRLHFGYIILRIAHCELLSLLPVGILNSSCLIWNIWLFLHSVFN